jgi:hypothetical protein
MNRRIMTAIIVFGVTLQAHPQVTDARPARIEKRMLVPCKNNRPPVTGFAAYASNDASLLMHCHGWEDYSDGYDDYGIEISRDNGKTWSDWTIKWNSIVTPEGRVRYAEPAAYWDPDAEQLTVLIDKSLYPNDTLTHQTQYQVVEYVYDPKTDTWSDERPLDLGAKSLAVSFSFPIKTARGVIMVSAMRGMLDAEGNIVVDERSGTPVYEPVTIRGRRDADGRIVWSLGSPIPVDRSVTTRGMDEHTYAELADGRVAALIRASNAGAPDLPGYKWLAFTADDGLTWSRPVPMPADTGDPIESGANGSALFRSTRDGKLYWIGNLCRDGERPNGNRPRHTLMLVEIQEDPFAFKRDSIFIIDEQEPGDTPALQISNFRFYQDRETGDLVVFAPRLGAQGRDWRQSDYYRYRVAMP